jgi:hypothetical protein
MEGNPTLTPLANSLGRRSDGLDKGIQLGKSRNSGRCERRTGPPLTEPNQIESGRGDDLLEVGFGLAKIADRRNPQRRITYP